LNSLDGLLGYGAVGHDAFAGVDQIFDLDGKIFVGVGVILHECGVGFGSLDESLSVLGT
jgi:hypothetical protein